MEIRPSTPIKVNTVAICLSGELRTFHDPCALQTIIDRTILPLRADVFVCVSIPSHPPARIVAERARASLLHNLLVRSVNQSLIIFNVTEFTFQDRPACADAIGCHGSLSCRMYVASGWLATGSRVKVLRRPCSGAQLRLDHPLAPGPGHPIRTARSAKSIFLSGSKWCRRCCWRC